MQVELTGLDFIIEMKLLLVLILTSSVVSQGCFLAYDFAITTPSDIFLGVMQTLASSLVG